jgi:hypothetical protein
MDILVKEQCNADRQKRGNTASAGKIDFTSKMERKQQKSLYPFCSSLNPLKV